MTTYAQTSPPPPPLTAYVAAALELGIVATFAAHHSLLGLALCAGYSWFSATWSLFTRGKDI